MNTPVSFEIAKLLKGKSFKEGSQKGYLENGELGISHYSSLCYNDDEDYPTKYAAPTIAEVVMWLYETHGIWIAISHEMNDLHQTEWFWVAVENGEEIASQYLGFNSPTKAYEAGINYCLTNLI